LKYEADWPLLEPLHTRLNFSDPPRLDCPYERTIWRILATAAPAHITAKPLSPSNSPDVIDVTDHISVLEFTTNFGKYEKGFKKFGVTPEEFFYILHELNKKNE
jgi:hypothetical protein